MIYTFSNNQWLNARVSGDSLYEGTSTETFWSSGIWYDGIWLYGKWIKGMWMAGHWIDGEWISGTILTKNYTINYYAKSEISPKSFFKPIKTLSLNYATYQ